MNFEKIDNKGQATIFRNKYLEFFTKTHPLIIWGMYIPVISLMLYYAFAVVQLTLAGVFLTFIGGVISWTLFEYLVHRFAFHLVPETELGKRIVYIIHGNHHEFPRDKDRLFMPPLPSIIIASVIFGLQYAIGFAFGIKEFAFAFFPGFMLGYLIYGTMHYAIHAAKPPFRWMKSLWRNHHLHHYKDGKSGFGVSTTIWDRVFNTMYRTDNYKLYRSGNSEIGKAKIRKMRF